MFKERHSDYDGYVYSKFINIGNKMNKVQILSLRLWTKPDGITIKTDKRHFKQQWRFDSVEQLFAGLPENIAMIPEKELWNLYYTGSLCKEEYGRKFVTQSILPIDIDSIDTSIIPKYVTLICEELSLDETKVGIVASGNGIQIIIGLKNHITSETYFDEYRPYYKALCGRINTLLFDNGLTGDADPSVFSPGRLLRLPFTKNIKEKKGEKNATLICGNIIPSNFDIVKASGLPELIEADHINTRALKRLPKPDSLGVQEGCGFLKYAKDNQEDISEPEWYAMLSIIGRLEDGSKLVHEYSKNNSSYSPSATDTKMNQALEASGPRTCQNIEGFFEGCLKCEHFGKIKSPIQIRGENHIATKDTGFWNTVITKTGDVKRTTPNFDDLVRFYDTQHKHVVIRETELVYHWNAKYWQMREKIDLNSFIEQHMEPTPNSNHCKEFVTKMKRTHLQNTSWMTVKDKINLSNGVIDVTTGEFTIHKDIYGFPYVLPFEYQPNAIAPKWEKFIGEITCDRESISMVLQEFMGMCIGFVDPTYVQKSAILLGNGANGKSVFLAILKALLGTENYSVVPLAEAATTPTRRVALVSKMANITEETPRGAFMESSFFKDIVSGGEIEAHKMYHGSFKFKNTAKIIMACNEMPPTDDLSNGMRRRLLIVPFDRTFSLDEQDPTLPKILEQEIPGIFNWAMQGLARLQANNWKFTYSQEVEDALAEEIDDNNPAIDWIYENLEIAIEHDFEPIQLIYNEFCLENKHTRISLRKFSKLIRVHIATQLDKPIVKSEIRRNNGIVTRVIPYIKMREVTDASF